VAVPDGQTEWTLESGETLTADTPVTLTWDNGQGLTFRRTIGVDENYMFTVDQSVENAGTADVTLFPYSRVARLYTPQTQNFFILHEGPIGVLGDANLVERSYSDLEGEQQLDFASTGGWLGFTDKYWATAIIPPQDEAINARFYHGTGSPSGNDYRANFVSQQAVAVPAGGSASHQSLAFAGAKVESIIDGYERGYGIDRFELIIDWGWFHFITKPMFYLIRLLYEFLGNFGLAILAVTVIIKAIFFPLANKSYASMANMRCPAAGDDGALQDRKDQSGGRVLADPHPDSGVLLALQGSVRHHRNAARAVLRLDTGFGRARSDAHLQPVRTAALRPERGPRHRLVPGHRHLAGHHGHHHVGADAPQPAAGRSHPGNHLQLDAGDLHLHAGHFPGRVGDLLGLEQLPFHSPAMGDHEAPRGRSGLVRQHQEFVQAQAQGRRIRILQGPGNRPFLFE
jgi:hypothetical protein